MRQYIALVGYPNCGKTTLFNRLTQLGHKTVNYPGSTVDYGLGKIHGKDTLYVIDTPGIVSLVPKTKDEEVTISTLDKMHCIFATQQKTPHLTVFVLDATQLNRQLCLAKQLIALGYPMLIAMTMIDEARKKGLKIDTKALQEELGCQVVCIEKKTDIVALQGLLEGGVNKAGQESDLEREQVQPISNKIDDQKIKDLYKWSEKVSQRCTSKVKAKKQIDLDKWVLHTLWGPGLFILIMSVLFWSVFALAGPFMEGIDQGVGWVIGAMHTLLPKGLLSTFLADGLVAALGAVVIFAPQILILFFWLGVLEHSGFLARGAILVDRPLSKVGLNGRSFVPLLSACACAIPAMMAARTIPGKKQRFLTLFVIPLMTCSARLPVYGLLLAILLPHSPIKSGLGMTAIYLGSIVLASIVAALVGRVMKQDRTDYFHMELPPWRKPQFRDIAVSSLKQTKSFIVNAGPIIVIVALILWVLGTYPTEEASYIKSIGGWLGPIWTPMGVDWRVGVALLLAFAAREVFVSVLVLMFTVQEESLSGLLSVLKDATFLETGEKIFTTASGIGLIIFFMIAMQCMSTMAIAKREMGSMKASLAMTGFYIGLAYILAVITVQGLRLLGIS